MARQLNHLLQTHRGPALLVDARSRRVIAGNQATARAYGYPVAELPGLPIEALWPAAPAELDGASPEGLKIARHRRSDGGSLDMQVSVLDEARRYGAIGLALKGVNERAFSLALIETQSRVLERIAVGESLASVLEALVVSVEALSGDMLGSALLLGPDGEHVTHGAAPHLPKAYWSALDGAKIGPAAGSCGTAMYSGQQVIVSDIDSDFRWRDYKTLALKHGLRACWSTPITSPRGPVLGAFALYYRDVREPGPHEQQLVQVAAELAAIAVERERVPAAAAAPEAPNLSQRELQVVRLIARGEPVKRVAAALRVSISTVYTHRTRIFSKLGVDSNVALARYAVRHRLVH